MSVYLKIVKNKELRFKLIRLLEKANPDTTFVLVPETVYVGLFTGVDNDEIYDILKEEKEYTLENVAKLYKKRLAETTGNVVKFPSYDFVTSEIYLSMDDYEELQEEFSSKVEYTFDFSSKLLEIVIFYYISERYFDETLGLNTMSLKDLLDNKVVYNHITKSPIEEKLWYGESMGSFEIFKRVDLDKLQEWITSTNQRETELYKLLDLSEDVYTWKAVDFNSILTTETLQSFIQYFNLEEDFLFKLGKGYGLKIYNLDWIK